MTDEQIIKALECCSSSNVEHCRKCPLISQKDELFSCLYQKQILSLDLINRQKAEIERVKKRNTLLLKKKCKDINTARKIIKSEAIKEFAERLKSRLANLSVRTKTHGRKTTPNYVDDITNQILHDVVPQEIDNLVKEMTEVQE